jgi:hypothetical protein
VDAQQLIIDSAEAAARTVDTPNFAKLTAKAVELTGSAVAAHLVPSDAPGLLVPVEIEVDGKPRVGAVLALGDRAILAWTTMRMLKISNYEAVVPYDSIAGIEHGQGNGNREILRIHAQRTWRLQFAAVFAGGRSIVPFLKGVLEGEINPAFSEGSG